MQSEDGNLVFRITGPQSIERLEPLVPLVIPKCRSLCFDPLVPSTLGDGSDSQKAKKEPQVVHFVWETSCEKAWRDRHSGALVLNKLHNSTILEDKAHLAFLQLRMKERYENVLPTFVASNTKEVMFWAESHWSAPVEDADRSRSSGSSGTTAKDSDWWVVKAASGNGGKDVWIISRENYKSVISETLPYGKNGTAEEEMVIQKFVSQPLLHSGKKFHFRCYTALRADMSALVYQMAYILTAGYHYNKSSPHSTAVSQQQQQPLPGDSVDDMDPRKLITNLSVNKHIAGYPGQLPCDVLAEYPALFHQICSLWKAVAIAATPFMKKQKCANFFEFYGIDVIADQSGRCWLIEINRLPGLESSSLNKRAEDDMYDTMMTSLLHVVLRPLKGRFGGPEGSSSSSKGEVDAGVNDDKYGLWNVVHGPTAREKRLAEQGRIRLHPDACVDVPDGRDADADAGETPTGSSSSASEDKGGTASTPPDADADTYKNTFSWRAFTKKGAHRELVMVSASAPFLAAQRDKDAWMQVLADEARASGGGVGGAAGKSSPVEASSASREDVTGGGASAPSGSSPVVAAAAARAPKKAAVCSAPGCSLAAPLRCSSCKRVSYCSVEHQKQHWQAHKGPCKEAVAVAAAAAGAAPTAKAAVPASSAPPQPPARAPAAAPAPAPSKVGGGGATGEVRMSHCMFCGADIKMTCEEDAHAHMRECPSLQEQLTSKDQFTIPKALRDKGVTLTDVKNAPSL